MGSLAELRDSGKGDGALAPTTIPRGKDMGKRMKKMLTGRWGGAKGIVLQSMVAVAQLVESQVVALVAVGSSPTSHPIKFSEKGPVLPGLLFFAVCLRVPGSRVAGRSSESGRFPGQRGAFGAGRPGKRTRSGAQGIFPRSGVCYRSLSAMAAAARRPAPMAEMTVAAPVTMSPPAKTLGRLVSPVFSSVTI